MSDFIISKIQPTEVESIKQYVIDFRQILFPMLDPNKMPKDLLFFKACYIDHPDGCFLLAKTATGELAGVIGMMPYDHRFPFLNYESSKTVEVARLFVEPRFRRKGLAMQLFNALHHAALEKGIETLYLHTHPFLTGAFEYWQKNGFQLIKNIEDDDFITLHMQRAVTTEDSLT